jgi:hypothetical protein
MSGVGCESVLLARGIIIPYYAVGVHCTPWHLAGYSSLARVHACWSASLYYFPALYLSR